jgi:hypothetical protein
MKRQIVVLPAIVLSQSIYGQDREQGCGNFDFEAGLGMPVLTSKMPEAKSGIGLDVYLE